MPAYNYTACCKEVRDVCKTHPCSKKEKLKFSQGYEIRESLVPTKMHQVYEDIALKIQRENKKNYT